MSDDAHTRQQTGTEAQNVTGSLTCKIRCRHCRFRTPFVDLSGLRRCRVGFAFGMETGEFARRI